MESWCYTFDWTTNKNTTTVGSLPFALQIVPVPPFMASSIPTLDGVRTGPKFFSGWIGIQLSKIEKLQKEEIGSNYCEVSVTDAKILNKTQQYLLRISSDIKSGNIPVELSAPESGPLSNSRWLTTANRLFRLYVSVETHSDKQKKY